MKKTDLEIEQAVLCELKWDTCVEETDVGVKVDAGVVTLTGAVSSWAKRMAAQGAAHRVAGVLYVANDVHVVPGTSISFPAQQRPDLAGLGAAIGPPAPSRLFPQRSKPIDECRVRGQRTSAEGRSPRGVRRP